MFQLFLIGGCAVIALILVAMAFLLSGEGAREQKLMIYFLCGSLLHNVAYLLEMTATSPDAALVAVKLEYLGSVYVSLLYCCFLFSYCYKKLPEWIVGILMAVDTVVLVLVMTCDYHQLYYRELTWEQGENGHYFFGITYGPFYYAFLIFSCGIPLFLSIGVLLKTIISSPNHAQERQYKGIMVLSLLPFLALLLYACKLTGGYDPTPAIMGLMLSSVEILVWRRRNYDFRHLAADAVLQSMSGGVVALDDQRRIVSYNKAATKIFPELGPESLGDSIDRISIFTEGMLAEDQKVPLVVDGRYYESQTKKIYSKRGALEGYTVLVLDVTDTRKYIEEIKRVREEAEQANQAKSEFLATMSHEIRTPMNAITGLSDIIIEESRGRKMYSYARDIKGAAKNLLSIINDILDLSKVEAGKMELVPVDYYVKSAVSEVVGMMDIAASQRGLLMKYEYDLRIPCQYNGDVGRIKQVLINLLNNALKFTRRGYVKISVSGHAGEGEDEEILIFQVQDTGCGIRKEDQEKIFENFQRLDESKNRSTEGTGLGLSITKKLVELMGGTIALESVYGEGSTFTVTIPQKIVDHRTLEEYPDVPISEAEQAQMFTAEGYKVLLVDDNLVNRKVARRLLESYKFELMEAASGPEAIELVKKKCYDIIFMDHMMPEMDGVETVKIIRERCGENGTKPIIIALTANAMAGMREMFLKNGFNDFLAKPLDRKDLSRTLSRWIPDDRRKYFEEGEEAPEEELEVDELEISGIDMDAILGQYPQMEDYREILGLYCMDSKRKLPFLEELVEKRDFKNYEIEVHALKSASANIGAMELSDLAKEHELAAARGNEAFVLKNYRELLFKYKKQVQYIERFLNQEEPEEAEEEGQQEIEAGELIRRIAEALDKLEGFHSKECAAEVEALLGCRLAADTRARLEEIQGQLKLYEDDKAELLLHALLDVLNKEE